MNGFPKVIDGNYPLGHPYSNYLTFLMYLRYIRLYFELNNLICV